jgi:hypothetical protein
MGRLKSGSRREEAHHLRFTIYARAWIADGFAHRKIIPFEPTDVGCYSLKK